MTLDSPTTTQDGAALQILLVDDDDGDRALLRRTLKNTGLLSRCTEATSVLDALRACQAQSFDCTIIDYQMPGIDGLEGVVALHRTLPFMSILMATGQGDEILAAEAIKQGASEYFPKSAINPPMLRHVIENAVAKSALSKTVAEQRQQLEQFASVLAHDLSAPARSLALLASFLKKSSDTASRAEFHSSLEQISETAGRMCTSSKRCVSTRRLAGPCRSAPYL